LPITIPAIVGLGWDGWAIPAISGVAVTLAWAAKMSQHSKLLWLVEGITRRDIDGDGQTGKPEKPPAITVHVDHKTEHGYSSQLFDLPEGVSEAMFNEFIESVLAGASTAESGWTGGGNLFSLAQYASIRDNLFLTGLANWKGKAKNQGWGLTKRGLASLPSRLSPPSPGGNIGMTPQSEVPV
jgi:hypothetical protein